MRLATTCVCACLLVPTAAAAQVDHLEILEAPRLLNCDPQPYFRIVVNAVDANRRPVALGISEEEARKRFEVHEGETSQRVRWVGLSDGGTLARSQGNYALFLLDTSGSMNARLPQGDTRFAAAKNAVRRSLANFADGVDHVAVVPFDSHNVVNRIRNSTFQSSRQGVDQQLDAIPEPQKNNNTALYTAVAEALPILKRKSDAGFAVSLVVFTDGENDVNHPGDDAGLLGSEGLSAVRDLASKAKVPITTVGFGVGGNNKTENALRDIAWPNRDNYYDAATNAQRLAEVFEIARKKLTDRIQILFGPVRPERDQLAGQSIVFRVRLRTSDGYAATRFEQAWNAPAVGVPVPEARCATEEAKAIVNISPDEIPPPSNGLVRRLGILVMFSVILASLWFVAPRFVWPDRYIPKPSFQVPQAPQVAGVSMGPVDRPRAPSWQAPPPRPVPSPGPAGVPRGPVANDQTVFVPARPQSRPAAAPPPAPRMAPRTTEPPPPSRTADDETVFLPIDPNPKKGR